MTDSAASAPTSVPAFDLRPQARAVAALAAGTGDGQLTAPTPCPGMPVRTLLAHLNQLSAAFRDAARKDLGPVTDTPPDLAETPLPDDWRTALPRHLTELAEAWRAPDAWSGETRAGGITMPADVTAAVAVDELVVHGWDLARATGQDYAPDAEAVRAAHTFLAPMAGSTAPGLFGAPVPVPDDAPLLDRVIGLSGRDPYMPTAD